MLKVVQLRLIAETEADAENAIAALRESVGSARITLSGPQAGRRGGWLVYGTLQVEGEGTHAPSAPATGKTMRLAKQDKNLQEKRNAPAKPGR